MANTRSYPSATAKSNDLILGTSMPLPNTNDDPRTVNFSIGQINGLANSPDIATAVVTVTNAQLATLGTVPVAILPAVTGYIYEILGITTTSLNTGGAGNTYDWAATGGAVFYGAGSGITGHRVEIPFANLPIGDIPVADIYVATPIAGIFRSGSGITLETKLGTDPVVTFTPIAQFVVNVTYRLIQVE
jgi:hypothetical protein